MKKKKPDPYLIDEENPEWTDDMFRNARSTKELFTELWGKETTEKFLLENRTRTEARKAGRPKKEVVKTQLSLRLDSDIVAAFRERGRGWQSAINTALREWIGSHPAAKPQAK